MVVPAWGTFSAAIARFTVSVAIAATAERGKGEGAVMEAIGEEPVVVMVVVMVFKCIGLFRFEMRYF